MTLPTDFIGQIRTLLVDGTEAAAFLDALQSDSSVSIRLNRRKVPDMPLPGEPVPWCVSGCYLAERPSFTFDPLLHAGGYYVQEASSMFVAWVLRHCVGDAPVQMLDLCAAPGGKSTLACDALPAGSVLVANEVVRSRAQVLAENLTKWGSPNVVVTHNDPADFTPLGALFDVILVDAPCSGEGMFRKDPASAKEWSLKSLALCACRQRRILADILPCLKPGGILVYSTCTYNIKEDEENVRWLRDEQGMEIHPVPDVPDGWGITGNLLLGEDFPVYRFLPHRTKGEGFFLALLRKPADAEEMQEPAGRKVHRKGRGKSDASAFPKEAAVKAKSWLDDGKEYVWEVKGAFLTALPAAVSSLAEYLRPSLRILQAGIPVGEVKGRDLLPQHALAMSTDLHPEAFPRVEVDYDQAIAYLRRETVSLPADAPRGFVLLTWRGLPLGFVKNIGNRANNLYPQEWRIRKQS